MNEYVTTVHAIIYNLLKCYNYKLQCYVTYEQVVLRKVVFWLTNVQLSEVCEYKYIPNIPHRQYYKMNF